MEMSRRLPSNPSLDNGIQVTATFKVKETLPSSLPGTGDGIAKEVVDAISVSKTIGFQVMKASGNQKGYAV